MCIRVSVCAVEGCIRAQLVHAARLKPDGPGGSGSELHCGVGSLSASCLLVKPYQVLSSHSPFLYAPVSGLARRSLSACGEEGGRGDEEDEVERTSWMA